ncbi:LLM class F420-dependent oxidoreductase [Ornithinicoccus halotolerans]|uniref:LLM class F420-dependent oxidoreductase n=1 Tax=Ornithinicoccus halotolerans TaxID=1748220 RepID=UPI001295D430|nr:LLM class F420-dependent oxidoreductase [Ornithinicoccus halotolerans]
MRLGVTTGLWGRGRDEEQLALVQRAEELGVHIAWVPEAYGYDAATVLAWIGARCARIRLGAGVLQIPGRTPAMTAMTAASLDGLSGGRFELGLGVSGPQVSEGWHGVRFARPLARTREYVEIVRTALARRPLSYQGEHFTLPLPDGPGKPLRLATAGPARQLPVHLAAVGPRNTELAGEIADGWLGVFLTPEHTAETRETLGRGRARSSDPDRPLQLTATVPVAVGDDVAGCADLVRDYAALYLGGMGSRQQNFYNALARRLGHEEAAEQVQEHYLAGRHREAAAAVPLGFLDETSLLGPPARLEERLGRYAEAGLTTLALAPHGPTPEARTAALEAAVAAADRAGVLS